MGAVAARLSDLVVVTSDNPRSEDPARIIDAIRRGIDSSTTAATGSPHLGITDHNQFIAIAGFVDFRSDDPKQLPTTTTKRGIDVSNVLYLQVKNKMREGMRLFTNYTNKWKGFAEESHAHIKQGAALSLEQLKQQDDLPLVATKRTVLKGQQFKPTLPLPKAPREKMRRISFTRDIKDIRRVAENLLEDSEASPTAVGECCFDLVLRESSR